jgi:hypothetical protein
MSENISASNKYNVFKTEHNILCILESRSNDNNTQFKSSLPLHGIITQKTSTGIFTAVKTSNVATYDIHKWACNLLAWDQKRGAYKPELS